jgi:hypothetical protein
MKKNNAIKVAGIALPFSGGGKLAYWRLQTALKPLS